METTIRLVAFIMFASIPCSIIFLRPSAEIIHRTARILGRFVAFVTLAYNAYYLSPATFRVEVSLPLQVCDLLGFAAILALILDVRFARAVIVLCVVPFVSQAVLTPVGEQHISSLRTILYWIYHLCLFSTFLFETFVRRFRPSWKDFAKVILLDVGYVALISALNVPLGWNYGYIGATKPGNATIIDALGPWPLRIATITLLAIAMQSICFFAVRSRGSR